MFIRGAFESDFESIWQIFKAVIEPGDTYVFAPDTDRKDAFFYWFGVGIKVMLQREKMVKLSGCTS
jgi:hypothetical protein